MTQAATLRWTGRVFDALIDRYLARLELVMRLELARTRPRDPAARSRSDRNREGGWRTTAR